MCFKTYCSHDIRPSPQTREQFTAQMAQMSTQLVEAATSASVSSAIVGLTGGAAVGQAHPASQASGSANSASSGLSRMGSTVISTGALHTTAPSQHAETYQKLNEAIHQNPQETNGTHAEDDNDEDADGVVTHHTHQFESLSVPVFSGGPTDLAATEVCARQR